MRRKRQNSRSHARTSKPSDSKEISERTPRSSISDTEAVSAVSDTQTPGKYDHVLPDSWFIKRVSRDYKLIFSSSVSYKTATQYQPYVDEWIKFSA